MRTINEDPNIAITKLDMSSLAPWLLHQQTSPCLQHKEQAQQEWCLHQQQQQP
jgi:hypothetical protein